MKLKVYAYEKCSTCRKALRFLDRKGIAYIAVPIREQPPTKNELRQMLNTYGGNIRKLFNTSGLDYKKLSLKEKLATMSADEAIDLLSQNGNLVKRPFVLVGNKGLVGFSEDEWKKLR